MNATITYRLTYKPSPLCQRSDERAYILVKVVTPLLGETTEQDVAIFNLDSEGRTFGAHVYAGALYSTLVDLSREMRESFELAMRGR